MLRNSNTDKLFFLLLKIIILEEKFPIKELNAKINIEHFKYLSSSTNLENLYPIIKKQRLSILTSKSKFVKQNMSSLFNKTIKKYANIAKENCFINFSLLCETFKILNKEEIEILFFKGLPLSLQTTGSILNRGLSKDIDILVRKKDLIKTIEVLLKNGFLLNERSKVFLVNNLYGSYARNVVSQITLFRNFANYNLKVDLHWNLSFIKNKLPNIENIFNNKEFIILNDINIPTLSKKNALIHTSIHNGIDGWRSIRGIIDFYRLLEIIDKSNLKEIKNNNLFIKNCSYCYQLLEAPGLKNIFEKNLKINLLKSLYIESQDTKLSTNRLISKKDWNLKKRIKLLIIHLNLTKNPVEIMRILFNHFLPPKDLWCNSKQRYFLIHEIIIMRIIKIYIRIFT